MRLSRAGAGLALLACFTHGGVAVAAEPPCTLALGTGPHSGFFARSEPGLAFFWASVSGAKGPLGRTGIRGLGQSGAIDFGGTPAPGLVLGGTVWTARIDPVFIENGRKVSPDDDSVKVTQLRLGPFLDWYPNPARGFHTAVSLGLVVQIESDVKGNPIRPLAFGAALATATGYEWFLSDVFSLGFLGRFAFGSVLRSADEGGEHTLFIVPELALSATYH